MLIELYDGLTSKRMRSVWLIARQRRDLNTTWATSGYLDISGEHTRPRVWCSASRRTGLSGGDAGKSHAGTRALSSIFSCSSPARYCLPRLVARCADGSRFQLIAATLDHLVSDLVDHFLDKQAQVTSTTEI